MSANQQNNNSSTNDNGNYQGPVTRAMARGGSNMPGLGATGMEMANLAPQMFQSAHPQERILTFEDKVTKPDRNGSVTTYIRYAKLDVKDLAAWNNANQQGR